MQRENLSKRLNLKWSKIGPKIEVNLQIIGRLQIVDKP